MFLGVSWTTIFFPISGVTLTAICLYSKFRDAMRAKCRGDDGGEEEWGTNRVETPPYVNDGQGGGG
jgi:hypothetical protein